jgi:hypothetical protein
MSRAPLDVKSRQLVKSIQQSLWAGDPDGHGLIKLPPVGLIGCRRAADITTLFDSFYEGPPPAALSNSALAEMALAHVRDHQHADGTVVSEPAARTGAVVTRTLLVWRGRRCITRMGCRWCELQRQPRVSRLNRPHVSCAQNLVDSLLMRCWTAAYAPLLAMRQALRKTYGPTGELCSGAALPSSASARHVQTSPMTSLPKSTRRLSRVRPSPFLSAGVRACACAGRFASEEFVHAASRYKDSLSSKVPAVPAAARRPSLTQQHCHTPTHARTCRMERSARRTSCTGTSACTSCSTPTMTPPPAGSPRRRQRAKVAGRCSLAAAYDLLAALRTCSRSPARRPTKSRAPNV